MDTPDGSDTLLAKADEVRAIAKAMRDEECRRQMLAIAAEYEAVAVRLTALNHTIQVIEATQQLY
jgi:hypothetical protein